MSTRTFMWLYMTAVHI